MPQTTLARRAPPGYTFGMFTWVFFGFLLGLQHALEADHIAAVASLTADKTGVRNILRHGAEVQVLAPQSLRTQVQEAMRAALKRYESYL